MYGRHDFDGKLAFARGNGLVFTDGTPVGTRSFRLERQPKLAALPNGDLLVSGDRKLQVLHNGVLDTIDTAREAWTDLISTADGALFVAEYPAVGREIFFTNGRVGGTKLVSEVSPGAPAP